VVLVLFAASGADDHRRLLANKGRSLNFRADDSWPDVLGSSKHNTLDGECRLAMAGPRPVSYTARRGVKPT
jgi:hypothetical protein